jgi:trk system potassium uptake protein TrkH
MMMALRPIFYALGLLMILLAAAMMIPAAVNAAQLGSQWEPFILSSCMTGFLGVMMALAAGHTEKLTLGIREAFLMTVISWLSMCMFAALPFMLNPDPLSFTDALFESVSVFVARARPLAPTRRE